MNEISHLNEIIFHYEPKELFFQTKKEIREKIQQYLADPVQWTDVCGNVVSDILNQTLTPYLPHIRLML